MEGGSTAGGGGGPAPFLLKTYNMVDDSATDEIVSWSSNKKSFVVWNPPEFARVLLPTYFKHNNFSSFIRQLNTYGFRKSDPERWEFANEDFIQDQKHLLKHIHRRKPIHSHSNPQGSMVDPERAALDDEIEKLSNDKAALEASISTFKQQRSAAKLQLENLAQRVSGMEQRQKNLLTFLDEAVHNPNFIEHLSRKFESMDFSAYNKKRRLPDIENLQPVVENGFVDNQSSSISEFGNVFHQDFSSKLRLELSPAVSDMNLVSLSTQSSNEDGGSSTRKISEELKGAQMRTEGLLFAPETLELSDTGTSFAFKMDSLLSRKAPTVGSPIRHSLQPGLPSNEEGDGNISCQLNLTLASTPSQVNNSPYSAAVPQVGQDINKSAASELNDKGKEPDLRAFTNKNLADDDKPKTSSQEATHNNQAPALVPVRVNDVFWEQFLTERPGCSENEEASSNYRGNPYDEQDDGRFGHGMSRTVKDAETLTL
ncbi:heat stress transcription factor A-5 [Pyrus x bretschneideri]|uniref:heat stress transcription factor A-5 n=1 Tax=Pyrus x bretschneideri TaxID=225117 RepID=UPI00202FBCBC|nr:heat stress transcription factor A-5 [Pyrus x bretschneideri]XP_009373553.2 heat stress transcription factor A-5 [Pyrus x bretschneideri]